MINPSFWKNKRVFISGHTGFKGSWLCLWLHKMGAKISGYALQPPTDPSLFELAEIGKTTKTIIADIRDFGKLRNAFESEKPEIVFHMAAQPLVRDSYKVPVDTYEINVMGTVNLLEAIRLHGGSVRAVVNITTDKVYENREWVWGYRENEPLGGYDPYSNSKACSELVTAAYRNSYFNPAEYSKHRCAIATARAGNVIGGGDWASDRLVPDCIRALLKGETIKVRNPNAVRPWQHVLEPLSGYLCLAQKLIEEGACFAQGWNFGPNDIDTKPVEWIVNRMCEMWGGNAGYIIQNSRGPHEAGLLKLDCSKSKSLLNWQPRTTVVWAIEKSIEWTKEYLHRSNLEKVCFTQIHEFESLKR
jgi:CDP-glucose 4,6-dehydratase